MRVLFAGTPAVAVPALRALLASEHEVVGVLTRPPAPVGRRRVLTPTPVHEEADDAGIPVVTSNRPHEQDTMERLRELRADVAAVVAYGALLREPALSMLPRGWVNLHFSLLPAWRGAAPVQHALMAGDATTGVSVFHIEAGLDTGPVFARAEHPIRPWHTSGDLLEELAATGAPLLVSVLTGIADGTARAEPQGDGASVAGRLTSADAHVDWEAEAAVVDRLIRATTPAPGAWTTLAGQRMKLGPVRPALDGPDLPPGVATFSDGRVWVGTGSERVILHRLAPAGKGWMNASDWARGRSWDAPVRLGSPAESRTEEGHDD